MIKEVNSLKVEYLATIRRIYATVNGQRRPTVTVAYAMRLSDNGCAAGISVCSPEDNPVKAEGDRIALDRAIAQLAGNADTGEDMRLDIEGDIESVLVDQDVDTRFEPLVKSAAIKVEQRGGFVKMRFVRSVAGSIEDVFPSYIAEKFEKHMNKE